MQLVSWWSNQVVGHIPSLLAHQGGWDEMLMVVVPVAAFAALLYGANRRASQQLEARSNPEGGTDAEAETTVRPTPPPPREPRNERGGPI